MSRNFDKDLPLHQALLEVMGARSVDSDSQFALFVFVARVSVTEGHDELIELIRSRLQYLDRSYAAPTREAAWQAIASLERKKRDVAEKTSGKIYPDCIRSL
jgi:hypothetical protein